MHEAILIIKNKVTLIELIDHFSLKILFHYDIDSCIAFQKDLERGEYLSVCIDEDLLVHYTSDERAYIAETMPSATAFGLNFLSFNLFKDFLEHLATKFQYLVDNDMADGIMTFKEVMKIEDYQSFLKFSKSK